MVLGSSGSIVEEKAVSSLDGPHEPRAKFRSHSCGLHGQLHILQHHVQQRRGHLPHMFSPSPYPQNATRRATTRNATPRLGVASPLPPGRRSRGGSRLTTPVRAPSESHQRDVSMASEDDGISSEMSVDADLRGMPRVPSGRHRAGVIFAQSEEMTVTLHSHFPTEVQQAIRNAGMLQSILSYTY